MPFQKLSLHPSLVNNTLALGYVTPTAIQAEAIPAILAGRDLVATAQTGTGKTAAFMLPILHQLLNGTKGGVRALVVTPTRELAQQIDEVFVDLRKGTNLRSALLIGGAPMMPQEHNLRNADIVIATPGRLLDHLRHRSDRLALAQTLILDEADRMFDMGFLPDVQRIVAQMPARKQTLLFSATMPTEIARLCKKILNDPLRVAIGEQGKAAEAVTQTVYPVPTSRKTALIKHLLEAMEMPSVLIFTRTKHGAHRLAHSLSASGHMVAELHSDRTPPQRLRAMQNFRSGQCSILVATNIAARGLDINHITHVINYDVPQVPEDYVHRIGRTGRADAEGDAIVLVAPEEEHFLTRIEKQLRVRLPRRRVEGFNYTVEPVPVKVGARPPRHEGQFERDRRRKPARGQGRR